MNTLYLEKAYKARYTRFEKLRDAAQLTLDREIKRRKIKVHMIVPRIKPFDSLRDKVRRKDSDDPFTEIHDIVGIRVICLFLRDIEPIAQIVRGAFEVIQEEDKIHTRPPRDFGYMAVHLDVRLRGLTKMNNEYKRLRQIPFEIQIRTIAQDAWASVSHNLFYKQTDTIPAELERDFYALNGLFYVADTHFGMLRERQSSLMATRRSQ